MNYYAFEKLGFKKLKSYVYVKEDVKYQQKLVRQEDIKKVNQLFLQDLEWNVLEISLQG